MELEKFKESEKLYSVESLISIYNGDEPEQVNETCLSYKVLGEVYCNSYNIKRIK